jgi:phosphonate transport system substrate-binding protein
VIHRHHVRLWSVLVVLLLAQPAVPDCPRGALDDRYCDADSDLLADPPASPEDWSDPRALIFAYTPVEDPAVYRDVWSGFLAHLSRVTGREVVFFPVQSNAAQIEAMRSGRLHVAGFNTGSTPLAVNCAGYVPFTMMAAADGSYGYEMELITHPGSGVGDVAGVRGREIAFTSPTSNSGYKAPVAILKSQFGLIEGRDYRATFTGKHDNTLLGVAHGDYPVGAVANSVKTRMIRRGVVAPDAVTVLYTSATFPTTSFGYAHDLRPELAARVREAFASFVWAGTALEREYRESGEAQFLPVSYREVWAEVRAIDAATGVSYDCR